jgi:hypothetical protein
MQLSDAAPVLAGLISGIILVVIVAASSLTSLEQYGPPRMHVYVDGKEYVTGYDSHEGELPFGRGFGVDADSSNTLADEIVNVTRGSLITFSFHGMTLAERIELLEAWVTDPSSHDPYFLEKSDHIGFIAGSEIPAGEYTMTLRARWDVNGYGQVGQFDSRIRVLP